MQQPSYLEQDSESGEQLAIFTDMNVDKHNYDRRSQAKQRVIYLNSSASNKNLKSTQLAHAKSNHLLDSLPRPVILKEGKTLVPSGSIDSFRRPISGVSKDASTSRFKPQQ